MKGKKGNMQQQRLVADFRPGECRVSLQHTVILPDKSRDLQQTPVVADAYKGLLLSTKLRVIIDASLSNFN